ncbi:MAG: hypothetical protein RR623_07550 [Bacilli bacterium]
MLDKLIKALSKIKQKKMNKKTSYAIPLNTKDYKIAYYDLLHHIYVNDIYLYDRFVYASPSKRISFRYSGKEVLAISMYDNESIYHTLIEKNSNNKN